MGKSYKRNSEHRTPKYREVEPQHFDRARDYLNSEGEDFDDARLTEVASEILWLDIAADDGQED